MNEVVPGNKISDTFCDEQCIGGKIEDTKERAKSKDNSVK
jgi:hypothetical protein